MRSGAVVAALTLVIASQVSSDSNTLFRHEVPVRRVTEKPRVRNPADYDAVKDPAAPAHTPLVAAPVLRGAPPSYDLGPAAYELGSGPSAAGVLRGGPPPPPPPPVRPHYVPKPFVPRERKQVQKLQPAGPVLYTAPEAGYGGEPRYGSGVQVQDLSQVPGYPGKDYPLFPVVPETGFTCDKVPHRPGLYADPEAGCQAYHICGEDNRHGYSGADFLCTNGTLFNQYELTCDWWYNVDCSQATQQYEVNLDPYKNPYLPTPEEVAAKAAQYGAPAPPQYSAPLPPLNYA